jgi:hypothetical protein
LLPLVIFCQKKVIVALFLLVIHVSSLFLQRLKAFRSIFVYALLLVISLQTVSYGVLVHLWHHHHDCETPPQCKKQEKGESCCINKCDITKLVQKEQSGDNQKNLTKKLQISDWNDQPIASVSVDKIVISSNKVYPLLNCDYHFEYQALVFHPPLA